VLDALDYHATPLLFAGEEEESLVTVAGKVLSQSPFETSPVALIAPQCGRRRWDSKEERMTR
jgi:hypothetical protein